MVEELLDVLYELSEDERYDMLCEKIRKQNDRKEKWSMCGIAEELERMGMEKGMETGIFAMIRDNLDMGNEKSNILEKIVRYFSISLERADSYFNQVVVG